MTPLTVPITKSARRFGYIIFGRKTEERIKQLLNRQSKVRLIFEGADLGEKNVDWKYHRIPVGYSWTRRLAENASEFVLTAGEKNTLKVKCR